MNVELRNSVKEMEASVQKLKIENREYQESLNQEWTIRKKLEMECVMIKGEIGIANEKNISLNERLKDLKEQFEYMRFQNTKDSIQVKPNLPCDEVRELSNSEDVLLIGDSHLKRINSEWLLKKENKSTKIEICYKLNDTREALSSLKSKHQCIMIHC